MEIRHRIDEIGETAGIGRTRVLIYRVRPGLNLVEQKDDCFDLCHFTFRLDMHHVQNS